MRRIYLESIFGLIGIFITSLVLYEITVYQLTTDYEYQLDNYEAQANHELVQIIANNQGIESAHNVLLKHAITTRSHLIIYKKTDQIPLEVSNYFSAKASQNIFYDDDRNLWFRLDGSSNTYSYIPNEETLVRQKIELEDNLVWVFLITSFMLYSLGHLLIIFRRVKKLERAMLLFAEGDLSSRAKTSAGSAIGSLNASFNLMADQIYHLIESNRSLTNAVAHELRTPVFRIQWQAELLKDTTLESQQRATIESIVEDTEEMEQMIDELLYYAKLNNSHITLRRESFVLHEFLSRGLEKWRKENQCNITLKLLGNDEKSDIILEADRKLLCRALDNLVRNAIKYARTQVFIEVLSTSDDITIAIHDDGLGVEDEHKAYLFEPFYVGNKARNKSKSGHGLGLSIVKEICSQHDAVISVGKSNLLNGAVFTIVFPQCNCLTDKALQ